MSVIQKHKIKDYYFPVFIFLVTITGYWDSPIRKFISLVLPVLIITYWLSKKKFTSKIRIETILIFVYITLCFISSLFAYDTMNSLIFSARILVFFLLIAALHDWMSTRFRYLLFLKAIVLSGLVLSASIFYSRFFGTVIRELEGAVRAGGIYSNVNSAGFILYVSLVFAFLLYLEAKKRKYIIFIAVLLIGLFITGSRASMLALAITAVVYNLRFRLTKKIIVLATIGFIFAGAGFFFFKDKIILNLRLERGLSARQILYDVGADVAMDYPFFGVGLGNLREIGVGYVESYPISRWQKDEILKLTVQSSHNVYLETAAEIGIFGAFVLLLILLSIGYKYFRGIKLASSNEKNFYFLVWGLFVGLVIRNFFESNGIINRGWITIDIFFWIAYVIFLRYRRFAK
ncbi:O-antigen ligase family protein [Aggregatimonas sangjinii]|uniref:O-antigen ligase family protein n=2 Tax=Aggregatimonas sangjinii TaxID=2583587 RepID=A0A5B7SX49_9FLAO|nr:O-antigen ligase family protein [Aggregatimonas sangjinii]